MGSVERHKRVRAYRGLMPSPGRPSVAWRGDRVRFWTAIARGAKTEDACSAAGVSGPVGFRWFRHAGGVNPCLPDEVSGRYLSFPEREDIAVWHAQGAGVREIARRLGRAPSTVSRELRRNASTGTYKLDYRASTAQWHAERRARQETSLDQIRNGSRSVRRPPSGAAGRPARGATVSAPASPGPGLRTARRARACARPPRRARPGFSPARPRTAPRR